MEYIIIGWWFCGALGSYVGLKGLARHGLGLRWWEWLLGAITIPAGPINLLITVLIFGVNRK